MNDGLPRHGRRYRLRVDPIMCRAHGLCAELLPEGIDLDEWGYPLVPGEAVPEALMDEARNAVAACPTLALRLERLSKVPPRGI
jgi:ferredoxin